jgi:hypothetical protein
VNACSLTSSDASMRGKAAEVYCELKSTPIMIRLSDALVFSSSLLSFLMFWRRGFNSIISIVLNDIDGLCCRLKTGSPCGYGHFRCS